MIIDLEKIKDDSAELAVLRDVLKTINQLLHRSHCMCCKQEIPKDWVSAELVEKIEIRINQIETELSNQKMGLEEIRKMQLEKDNYRKLVKSYMDLNLDKIRKFYRDNELPDVSDPVGRKLWNDAVELFMEERDLEIEYDFF